MFVFTCSWTFVLNLLLSRLTTCWAQSFTRPNSTSTARRLTGSLMSAFQEISVVALPNASSHVAVEVFKGNFWVIVMSSRRQRRCGCSRHGAQLSAGTCRSRSWLYGVAPSDGTHAVPHLCFVCPLHSYNEREGCYGTSTLNGIFQSGSMKGIHFSLSCPFFGAVFIRFGLGPGWICSLKNYWSLFAVFKL